MKYLAVTVLLALWLFTTAALAISLIGILVIKEKEYLTIPAKLFTIFKN